MFENMASGAASCGACSPDRSDRRRAPAAVHRRGALDLKRKVGEAEAADYTKAGGLNYSFQGLARYWRKR
jgi:hypothetical protein